MDILTEMRTRDRYDSEATFKTVYWRAENVKMSDIIDFIATIFLMHFGISTEEWLSRREDVEE